MEQLEDLYLRLKRFEQDYTAKTLTLGKPIPD
jgi:hypothetical protein